MGLMALADFGLIWHNNYLFGLLCHFNLANRFGGPLASVREAWSLVIGGGMHASPDETKRVYPSSKNMMVLWLL